MKSTYSVSKAQSRFPSLVREAAGAGVVAITRHDETVAYVVSPERMEALAETMEMLANPQAMAAIRQYERGHTEFHPLPELDNEG